MEALEFSEEEIQQHLQLLGYRNISKEKLQEFKRDLDELMRSGDWTSLVSPENSQIEVKNCNSPPAFTKETGESKSNSSPAFTKETVPLSRCSVGQSGVGFFLHSQNRDEIRVLSPQNRRAPPPSGRQDSYSRHSLAPKPWLHTGPAPERIQTWLHTESGLAPEQTHTEKKEDSLQTHSFIYTENPRRIKRKVLRKHRGQSLVCDESFCTEDSGASFLEESLADLHLSPPAPKKTENDSESQCSETLTESAFQTYSRDMSRSQYYDKIRPKAKSFIRPVLGPKGPKKTDPVSKYFQYKQLWDLFKLPGENDRKALQWEIRERLAYQPPPPKPRRVLVPNSYIVPTEKKRSGLRWEVRNHLATGAQPHSYRF